MCSCSSDVHLNGLLQFLLEGRARAYEVAFLVVETDHLSFFIEELITFLGDGLRLVTEGVNGIALLRLQGF